MSDPGFESDLPETLDRNLSSFSEVKSLKAEQRLVIEKVVHGRDVFVQLPKRFGKSLTFQILPPLCKCLKSMGHNFPAYGKIWTGLEWTGFVKHGLDW